MAKDKARIERMIKDAAKREWQLMRLKSDTVKKSHGYMLWEMWDDGRSKPSGARTKPIFGDPGTTLDQIGEYLAAHPPKPPKR